jgi:hypothetical protein
MTSLTETLPILDQAVPALPGKMEAVAKEGDEFHQAAATALDAFHARRQAAEQLLEQVREALSNLHEQADHEHDNVQAAVQSAQQAAEHEAQEIEHDEGELTAAGQHATGALGALEAALVQASAHTGHEHQEARTALDGLGQQAHTGQPELQKAADAMDAALHAAQQAVIAGQSLMAQGVTALTAVMDHLVSQAQARLATTAHKLEELRAAQEKEVGEVLQALETGRGKVEQELKGRLETEVKQAVDPALDGAFEALGEMGQQVLQLQAESEKGREAFEHELGEVGGRIAPLQGGVAEVKKAAGTLGVEWPA